MSLDADGSTIDVLGLAFVFEACMVSKPSTDGDRYEGRIRRDYNRSRQDHEDCQVDVSHARPGHMVGPKKNQYFWTDPMIGRCKAAM